MVRTRLQFTAWLTLGLFAIGTLGCGGEDTARRPTPKPKPNLSADDTPTTTDDAPAEDSSSAPAATDTADDAAPAAGGWGTISGTFIYGGDAPPAQTQLNVTKDVEFCTTKHPLSEEIVVNPENKGIQNIVMTLSLGRGDTPPEPHESYGDPAAAKVNMDNQWCRFEPHVQFVQTGGTIEFGNEDEVGHNVKGDPFANSAFNQTVAAGATLDVGFEQPERLPFQVTCTIHPWMTGWVVVQDHPYVAISGDDGNFELKNVPSGTWEFQLWQEKSGYLKEINVKGELVKLSRGKWQINVHDESQGDNAAKNTFGDIVVPASNFE